MSEFFRGWRRKIGFVTLVMALCFMAGWVRSLIIGDILRFPVREITCQYASNGGVFTIESLSPDGLQPARWLWNTTPVDHTSEYDFFSDGAEFDWLWVSGDFLCYNKKWKNPGTIPYVYSYCVAAPYWSITVPLTLISLWLLLSKPRPPTPKTFAEPTSANGIRMWKARGPLNGDGPSPHLGNASKYL